MKKLLLGLAALPLLAATSLAQPQPLADKQMDKVSAGHLEIDVSNTSTTVVSIWRQVYLTDGSPNTISCSTCYLLILSPTFSVSSQFGH
jgi:hypothetical protein